MLLLFRLFTVFSLIVNSYFRGFILEAGNRQKLPPTLSRFHWNQMINKINQVAAYFSWLRRLFQKLLKPLYFLRGWYKMWMPLWTYYDSQKRNKSDSGNFIFHRNSTKKAKFGTMRFEYQHLKIYFISSILCYVS